METNRKQLGIDSEHTGSGSLDAADVFDLTHWTVPGARRTVSETGFEQAIVGSAIDELVRARGDHPILRREPPTDHPIEIRSVLVPLHDVLAFGPSMPIADLAGARACDQYCERVERNG